MELIYAVVSLVLGFVVVYQCWRFMKWVWFDPRRNEKLLREMGFRGNPYKFLIGDFWEMSAMSKKALLAPISLSDDVIPRVMPFILQTVANYGDNSFMWFGTKPAVLISDPEMVKEILAKNYTFIKTSNPLTKLVAQGVALYDGEKWAKHRKLVNPAFHIEKLRVVLPAFYKSCSDMLRKWEEIVPSEGSVELDVWPHLQTLLGDAISRTAFGSSYEEGQKVFELQKEQLGLMVKSFHMLLIPGLRFLPTKNNRRMREIKREVDSCILGVINKRLREIEAGEATQDDLLGILLESNSKEIKQHGTDSGITLTEVIDECKLFYIAGQETTSALLVWTMILLGQNPEWQQRARDEVLGVLGDNQPDFHQLNQLKVMSMIFFEVLRLYPAATMLSRIVQEETRIKNITLPAGAQVFLPTIMMQQDCRVWGEDAKEFKPERFSEGIFKATKGQLTYFPFGSGPRTCVGQNFAMLEAKMALAMILQRFSFEVSPSYAHAPEMLAALQPQMGAHLLLRRR